MKNLFVLILLFILIGCAPQPPKAAKIHHETVYHNQVLQDNYHWMKDKTRSKKEVLSYIQQENDYTKANMKHTNKLQQELFDEIVARSNDEDITLPIRKGDYHYFWKRNAESEYYDYYRKSIHDSINELLLDVNNLAKQFDYYDVSNVKMSPNHQFLSYLVDTTGSEAYTLQIKDITTGKILSDQIQPVGNMAWANDNHTLFYTLEDESGRSYQVFRHQLAKPIAKDELLYEEGDGKFYLWMERTRSDAFILLNTASKTTSETWFLSAEEPMGRFSLFEPRKTGLEYYLDHVGDRFYILTNADDAFNYKLMTTKIQQPSRKNWQNFISHRDSVYLNVDVFQDFIALYERVNGVKQLRIIDHDKKVQKKIEFPEENYSLRSYRNPEFKPEFYYFSYDSFITPYTIYALDTTDFSLSIAKQKKVLGDFQSDKYKTEIRYAKAEDGTKIPISLVYKKTLEMPAPVLLTAYGSYGDSSDPYFSNSRISLLDRNIIYSIAHVRGGGEFGKKWYDDGRLLHKKNTFTDFIACSEFLIEENYTTPDQFIIEGGSAGGLLIGVVINERPDLYQAAIADVPFVDVLNTMFDPTLSAVESEYEEWGNPNEKMCFDYIKSYCPYQNVSTQAYPNMLVLAGFYDPRVNYWEPLKWTAKLRDKKTDNHLLLLQVDMNSGHGGASGKFGYIKQIAFEYAFILDQLDR